jgi:hypothetical protein
MKIELTDDQRANAAQLIEIGAKAVSQQQPIVKAAQTLQVAAELAAILTAEPATEHDQPPAS